MVSKFAQHIEKMLPVWIVGIILSGFAVAGAGMAAWYDLNRDLDLIKCKLNVEDNDLCRWTSTIAEDIAKVAASEEEDSE